ncbi:MAG: DUF2306 domain-containing protein, partial [Stackebrandtia sp.]
MTTTLRPPRTPTRKTRWYRRPWIAPLMFIAGAFIAVSLPRYVTFNPELSLIEPPKDFPPYYGILVAHVGFASVAMATCCMQIWPRLRAKHPKLHRMSGRVYVIGGVIPAGLSALGLAWGSAFGPVASASTFIMAPLWMGVTIAGFRMARRRRFADHRRWMVRSFALTMSIIVNRFIGAPVTLALYPKLDTVFHGDETLLAYTVGGITTWTGWIVCLLLAEWWLIERGKVRR